MLFRSEVIKKIINGEKISIDEDQVKDYAVRKDMELSKARD